MFSENVNLLVASSPETTNSIRSSIGKYRSDVVIHRIDQKKDLREALDSREWHLVISDLELSDFSATELTALLQDKKLGIPVILIAGTGAEEIAVKCLESGIDQIIDRDGLRMKLLPPMIDALLRRVDDENARQLIEKELIESKERYLDIFKNTSDLIQCLAPDGSFLYTNSTWRQTMGYTEQEVRSLNLIDVLHPESLSCCQDRFSRLKCGESLTSIEFKFITKSGETIYLSGDCGSLMKNGESVSTRGIFKNITETVKAKELETTVNDLQTEVGEHLLTEKALRTAKDQAELASRVKNAFLARMSHELRTPLNAILGFAQLLESDDDEPLSLSQKESIKLIEESGWRLADMVNDLLDLSSIEVDKLELNIETVDLVARIQDSINLMQPLAQQCEITLQGPGEGCAGIYVQADPVRLRQVLRNLISNAVKYNHQGGSVTLSCDQVRPGITRVSVIDTGQGIAEADLPILFEPFNRLYLETYTEECTGIGLSIARKIIEGMGGSIGATSVLGSGSTFWIELLQSQPPA